jgi:hypothetical protein
MHRAFVYATARDATGAPLAYAEAQPTWSGPGASIDVSVSTWATDFEQISVPFGHATPNVSHVTLGGSVDLTDAITVGLVGESEAIPPSGTGTLSLLVPPIGTSVGLGVSLTYVDPTGAVIGGGLLGTRFAQGTVPSSSPAIDLASDFLPPLGKATLAPGARPAVSWTVSGNEAGDGADATIARVSWISAGGASRFDWYLVSPADAPSSLTFPALDDASFTPSASDTFANPLVAFVDLDSITDYRTFEETIGASLLVDGITPAAVKTVRLVTSGSL